MLLLWECQENRFDILIVYQYDKTSFATRMGQKLNVEDKFCILCMGLVRMGNGVWVGMYKGTVFSFWFLQCTFFRKTAIFWWFDILDCIILNFLMKSCQIYHPLLINSCLCIGDSTTIVPAVDNYWHFPFVSKTCWVFKVKHDFKQFSAWGTTKTFKIVSLLRLLLSQETQTDRLYSYIRVSVLPDKLLW